MYGCLCMKKVKIFYADTIPWTGSKMIIQIMYSGLFVIPKTHCLYFLCNDLIFSLKSEIVHNYVDHDIDYVSIPTTI